MSEAVKDPAGPGTAKRRLLYLVPALVFGVLAGYFLWGLNPDRDPRIARADRELSVWNALAPDYRTMHEMGGALPQECIYITDHVFLSEHFSGCYLIPSYARYLARADSGFATSGAPQAIQYGLDPSYEFYGRPPEPVIRDREGYTRLLDENRTFSLGDAVRDVYGFVPGPSLIGWLEEQADPVLFINKDTEVALQHRYREYETSGGGWFGYPVLAPATLSSLRPGRYLYVTDRYGAIRVARTSMSGFDMGGAAITHALLAHGEPLRAAGELVLSSEPGGPLRVTELNVRSEEYFFSNRSLTLYDDVEERSDRYVAAVGHVLRGLELARLPRDDVLIRKW